MPLEIGPITADDLKLKLLLYGKPGAGKTSLAATAANHPGLAPVLVADVEGGLLSIADSGLDRAVVRSTADLEELYWLFRQQHESVSQYQTLIIDSGSMAATRALVEWTERNIERSKSRGKRVDRTIDDVELQDYGKMGNQIRRLMTQFVDLPVNVIMTAIEKEFFLPSASMSDAQVLESIGPSFTKSLMKDVTAVFDHVWLIYQDEGERYLLTQRDGYYHAKTRRQSFADAIGSIVTAPDLPTLYETMLNSSGAVDPT